MPQALSPVEPKIMSPRARGDVDLDTIYVITPTFRRATQMVDLVRLSQTLGHDPLGVYWLVVEDAQSCTRRVRELLDRSGLAYAHVSVHTPDVCLSPQWSTGFTSRHCSKGVAQRNRALEILEGLTTNVSNSGVVYFGDDDNAYDLRLLPELRKIQHVGIFPVAYVGGGVYEACQVSSSGQVSGFATNWHAQRDFPLDMAGFGFRLSLLRERRPRFSNDWRSGKLETNFIAQLVNTLGDLEPLADMCTQVYVWHVHTEVSLWGTQRPLDEVSAQV